MGRGGENGCGCCDLIGVSRVSFFLSFINTKRGGGRGGVVWS